MKILHISDLHIGNLLSPPKEGERADELVKAIIGKWGAMDDWRKPVIVITGDIVDSGLEWQYEKAEKIIQKLETYKFEVVPVPGNHDYGPKGNFVASRFKKNYAKYIRNVEYPYVATEREGFTIIGLNSMEAETGILDKYWADGRLGRRQLNKLEREIKSIRKLKGAGHKIVLILHHHPFDLDNCKAHSEWWHCLKDGDKLISTIKGKVDVLLFGHEHEAENWKNKYRIPVTYMCDKSTRRRTLRACLITLRNGNPVAKEVEF